MSSVRRKLFKESSNTWTTETIAEKQNNNIVENGPTQLVEYTVVSEGDSAFKAQLVENPPGSKTPQESVFRRGASSFTKDLEKRILIVREGSDDRLAKQWTELQQLEDIQVTSCHSAELISICTQETFLLIFLEMSSVLGHAQKLCSTIRYNPSSLNRTVAIIGIMEEGSKDDFSSYGLNDIIHLPMSEKTMNQVLLKWAGHKSCEGMPLTPSSPEDRVTVAAVLKASETSKESKQPSTSLPHYNNPGISPSIQQSCNSNSEGSSCVTESYKPSQLQLNQSVPFHQQSFNNVQGGTSNGIPISNRGFVSLTQNNHTTNDSGLGQSAHTQVTSNIAALQHFVHAGNSYQDQQPPSLFLSRSAPEHIPVHSGLVPAHITSMVNPVYPPDHPNQSYIYHNQSVDPGKQNNVPHFLPTNTPSHYPSIQCPTSAGLISTNDAVSTSKPEQSPASTQAPSESSSSKGVGSPAYMISGALGSKDMKITLLHEDLSKHSSKERIRRERIKESCDQLRFLLPSVAGKKSDMASILEMTVKYVQMVKERLPPPVLQEISDNIIDTSPVLPRKRSNRDTSTGVKQGRPRLTPPSSIPTIHEAAPRLAHPLQPFYMRPAPFQPKAPTIVTTTGPMYVPHLHMRPGHEHPQIPLQQHLVHPQEPPGFRTATSPPSAFNSCSAARNIRSANVMQHISPHEHTTMNLHQDCTAPLTSFHSKHMYHGSHQTVPPRGHSYDMPQQWSFLKLPAIGNIFHSLSSTTLSPGNSEPDSCESNTSSPSKSSSMTLPLWENSGSMMGNRADHPHLESPTMYKGTSI
ncbi:uncharacterized protein [Montipora capricornis]|uniref:uncharacterized protein n=1 Tax=Montipora capricornis TaxID=246305 RepID=UPI0035F10D61